MSQSPFPWLPKMSPTAHTPTASWVKTVPMAYVSFISTHTTPADTGVPLCFVCLFVHLSDSQKVEGLTHSF